MRERTRSSARSRVAARQSMANADMADAGVIAAITSSALMVSCAAVANLLDRYPSLVEFADFSQAARQSTTRDVPDSFAMQRLGGPTEWADPVRLAIRPPASLNADDLARAQPPSTPPSPVFALDTDYDVSTPLALDAHEVSFDETGRLLLHAPASGMGGSQSHDVATEAHTDQGLGERMRQLGQRLVADWQASPQQQSDVALFVAADDETLSWALNRTSPNHGALAYADDQVELGELAVGVSMSLGEARVAAAYVEREYQSPLRGANGGEESFAGLTLTYRN